MKWTWEWAVLYYVYKCHPVVYMLLSYWWNTSTDCWISEHLSNTSNTHVFCEILDQRWTCILMSQVGRLSTDTLSHSHMHAHMHMCIHSHACARACTHAHTHTHTHTHTHPWVSEPTSTLAQISSKILNFRQNLVHGQCQCSLELGIFDILTQML